MTPAGARPAMSDRKTEILEIAKVVFAERGIKNSSVREIGARAGILSGSLYHHFASKLDMVDAILGTFCAEVLERYRTIAAAEASPVDQLRAMTEYAFSLIPDHAAAIVMILEDSGELVRDPRFRYLVEFNAEVERHWVDALARGVASGELSGDADLRITYRFIRDAVLGAIRWYTPGSTKPSEIARELSDLVLVGVTSR